MHQVKYFDFSPEKTLVKPEFLIIFKVSLRQP